MLDAMVAIFKKVLDEISENTDTVTGFEIVDIIKKFYCIHTEEYVSSIISMHAIERRLNN